jgi:hypothetical protein
LQKLICAVIPKLEIQPGFFWGPFGGKGVVFDVLNDRRGKMQLVDVIMLLLSHLGIPLTSYDSVESSSEPLVVRLSPLCLNHACSGAE